MGGWITLIIVTIGMYRIAENSELSGWMWAAITLGLFFLATSDVLEIPGVIAAGLCGLAGFVLMFGYKVAFDK